MNTRLFKLTVLSIVVLLTVVAAIPWRTLAAPPAQSPLGPRDPTRKAAPDLEAPVPRGPGFLMVNPFQFRSAWQNRTWDYVNGELFNPGPEDNFYEAALTLPDNIVITKMVVYFYDNSELDLCAGLWRFDPSTGDWLAMAEVASWGTEDQYRNVTDTSIIEPAVDQQRYSYLVEVGIPPVYADLRLAGVRLDYSYRGHP